MISLRYVDGRLQQETDSWWRGPTVLVYTDRPVELFPVPVFRILSHRERRRLARRGRKFPRRVAARVPHDPEPTFQRDIKRFDAHRLQRGSEDVLLYLPEGTEVVEAHCRDVERWLDDQVPKVDDAAISDLIDWGYRVVVSKTDGFVAHLFYQPVTNIRRWTLDVERGLRRVPYAQPADASAPGLRSASMKHVIYLDIDGVLAPFNRENPHDLDPVACATLRALIVSRASFAKRPTLA